MTSLQTRPKLLSLWTAAVDMRRALEFLVVESVPVHEDIKTGCGDLMGLFNNYAEALQNPVAEGTTQAVCNFMPVLDWVRTEMHSLLPDGLSLLKPILDEQLG